MQPAEDPPPAHGPSTVEDQRLWLSLVYCAGRWAARLVAEPVLGFLGLGLVMAAPGPCLLAMAQRTGSRLDQLSTIFIGRAVGYLGGTLVGGVGLDRAPSRGNWLISSGLLLSGLATLMVPAADSLPALIGLITAGGLAMGLLDTAGNVLLIRLHRPERVEPYMQALHFSFGLGACLAPLVLRAVLGNGLVYDQAFWGFGCWLLAVGLLVLCWESPMPQPQPDSPAAGVYWPVVIGTAVFLGLYVGLEVGFGALIHSFSVEGPAGLQPAQGELITACYWAGIAGGRLLAVPLAVWCVPSRMMLADLAGCLVCAGLLVLADRSKLALWAGAAGFGLSMASIFPTALNLAGTVIDVDGQAATFMVVGAAAGEMVLPLLAGVLFERAGPSSLPKFTLAVAALQAGGFHILASRIGQIKAASSEHQGLPVGFEKVELTSMTADTSPRHATLE